MNLGTAQIIRADSRHLPLADNSVDLVVTSPPYFALRSYQDGGVHYDKQIGAEPTPDEFVSSLLEVTAECVRVLKPSGSLWVNLGDKYSQRPGQYPSGNEGAGVGLVGGARSAKHINARRAGAYTAMQPKSLIGIPWRYALRCIDDLGLILRAEVIWSKPNGLPESVTDRVRRSHEQWFHFTLSPRYFSAVDEIRTPHRSEPGREGKGALGGQKSLRPVGPGSGAYNPLGALPGSVWTVPTEPLRVPDHLGVDHFAAFPTEWPKRIIQGWSPAGVCVACGEGRRPVVEKEHRIVAGSVGKRADVSVSFGQEKYAAEATITGYACACPEAGVSWETSPHSGECVACGTDSDWADECSSCGATSWPAPTTPAVILDPFGGTGTTAMVAKALGRHGISVDMSADYCRLAEWRTNDRDQLAKVLGVPKAQPVHADETSLLDLLGEETA